MLNNTKFSNFEPEVSEILRKLTSGFLTRLTIEFKDEGKQWRIILDSDNDQALIGEQGETLLALQHLLRTIFRVRHPESRAHFVLDVDSYRADREKMITGFIRDVALQKVIEDGGTIIIKGLNSYERRLVHTLLSEQAGIQTTSIGGETNRRLVIRPSVGINTVSIENAEIIDIQQYEKGLNKV
jgi:spoIIIJ-associated protein